MRPARLHAKREGPRSATSTTTPSSSDGPNWVAPRPSRRSSCGTAARLHRYLRVELRHESDAHDALQESLTAAWRGLPSLRRADRFWPWLVGIASHKAADIHRRRAAASKPSRRRRTHDDDLLLETREALSALPAQHREVLLLRYLLGLTEEEAAAALGVRVGTIKSRCSRARRALLEELG